MLDILCYKYNPVRFSSQISSITSTGLRSTYSNLDIIRGGLDETNKYATLEPNRWRLDGSYTLYDGAKFAYWASSRSRANGSASGSITITFSNEITLSEMGGVTVIADTTSPIMGANCKTYNGDTLISEDTFVGDTYIWQSVFETTEEAKITSVVISFTKTTPYTYMKIKNILFGVSTAITEEQFYDVQVLEEISIASDRIPANTLTFTLTATQAEIDNLQQTYRYIILLKDGVQYGGYYLDDIEKQNDNKFTLSCNDIIGILENNSYNDNLFISVEGNSVTIENVLDTIFEGIDCNYTLSGFNTSAISIKFQSLTKREALTHLLLSTNSVCKKLRNGSLAISRLDTTVKKDITENIFAGHKIVDNIPVSSISMNKVELTKGTTMTLTDTNAYMAERGSDYVVYGVKLPELIWMPTAQLQLFYTVSFTDIYGEFAVSTGLRAAKETQSFTSSHYIDGKVSFGSDTVYFKIDTETLRARRNEYGERPEHYAVESGKFLYRGNLDAQWGPPYISSRIRNADWSTFKMYNVSVVVNNLDTVTLGSSDEISTQINPNTINSLKKQDLQIQTVQIADLTINGTVELGQTTETSEIPIIDSSGQYTGETETVTTVIPINLILSQLMERYYQYPKVFEGKILAEGLCCGDTVSMTLPHIGYVTGTIQKLRSNLVNKEIADAQILLYYMG